MSTYEPKRGDHVRVVLEGKVRDANKDGSFEIGEHGVSNWINVSAEHVMSVDEIEPPRIPEPGLWGVVEAHPRTKGTRPVRFVRDSMSADEPWVAIADGSGWDWDDLIDPVLVRPGIEDGAS